MDKSKLERAMNTVVEGTKDAVLPKLGPGDDIATILFLLDKDGMITKIINLVTMGDIPPSVIEDALKETIQKYDAEGYIVQSTMWFVNVKERDLSNVVRPSLNPDRGECYVLAAGSRTDTAFWSFEIIRKDGKIVQLEPQDLTEADTIGLFQNLMGEAPTVH